MHRQASTWFQGWKVVLRCAEFRCRDGTRRFASTAVIRYIAPESDTTSLHWPEQAGHSIIFPEEAFDTRFEANADAASRARHEIMVINGSTDVNGSRIMRSTHNPEGGHEPDESLAARYEITFDGKRYAFRQHRYDLFRDALRYAMAQHAKDGFQHDESFTPSWSAAFHPTDEDEEAMRAHGIVYVEGHYTYGGFNYGQLSDAVAFAKGHPNL